MFKRNLVVLFFFLFLLLASGCVPKCNAEELASFTPILISPANGSEVSYNVPVTFDWTHNESCRPNEYRIFIDNVGIYDVDGDTTEFDYALGFSPGTVYEWDVVGRGKDENNFNVHSPTSETWSFTTDGMCSSASELEQPILTQPQFGEWLGNGQGPGPAHISWDYTGDCYPDAFHYQAASDPNFTNIITTGTTDWNRHYALIDVPKCARIYWRVQAQAGNSKGEYSEPSRFTFASTSSCFQNQQSIDASLIKGYVFEDYCPTTKPWVPDGVGIALPCIFGEGYGVHANGVRARVPQENKMTGEMDPAEYGIPGIVVDLGAGPCPSTGLDQFVTVENGNYYFMVQSPGEYCVSLDKGKNPDLEDGIWTLPLTDQDVTEATIYFNPGDDLMFQSFGWDQNDFLRIKYLVELLSVCRFGPSPEYPEVAFVDAGETIPIFARNEDATWFATLVNGKRCFISTASGAPADDPGDLMIFPKQPAPVVPEDTSQPSSKICSDYKSEETCVSKGCEWTWRTVGPGICRNP